MKTSTQLKALIRNLSKKSKVETEILLRNFVLERLLERIVLSKYKNNFILKGGMLIAAIVGIEARSTMDMDATIKGQTLSADEISVIIDDIIKVQIDDGVVFTYKGIEEIRKEADYPGYRVSIDAIFDKTHQTLKVDITTGDFVTPKEVEYNFMLMFEDRTISILAYNLETVLAEKFETIITRGVVNTRMRDFYDIYILTTTQEYNDAIFKAALYKTAEKRNTSEQLLDGTADTIAVIGKNTALIDLWNRYQNKYYYASEISWEMVIAALKDLAGKLG